VLKHNRSKSNIILTTNPNLPQITTTSLHGHQSLPLMAVGPTFFLYCACTVDSLISFSIVSALQNPIFSRPVLLLRQCEWLPLTTSVGVAFSLNSLPKPMPAYTAWLQQDPGPPATSGCRVRLPLHSTSWLRTPTSASAWLTDIRPQQPLPHTFLAVAGLVPRYHHLLHLLHPMVAHHSIGIGLVTQFHAMTPATLHFLGGHTFRRALPLQLTVGCHGTGIS